MTLQHVLVNGDIAQRPRVGLAGRRELAHVLRRRQGLVGAESVLVLARAEGLTDEQIRSLVASWAERSWPRR